MCALFRSKLLAAAIIFVGLLVVTPLAHAVPRTYNIVQAQSVVTASGIVLDVFNIEPQGAGSLVTNYTGAIVTDRATGTIQFVSGVNGSNIDASVNGNWLPGLTNATRTTPAPADYGGFVAFGDTLLAAQNLVGDLDSDPIGISSGAFDLSGITISFKGNSAIRYQYNLGAGDVFDTSSLVGDNYNSQLTGTGSISRTGLIETLTIPINVTIPIIVDQFPEKIGDLILTGQLVATATVPAHPGDFDLDGDVDGADFVAWQTNFPKATGATLAQGDADADGDVDGADFVVWQTNFPFSGAPGVTPIPEPASGTILLIGTISAAMLRRAQWRR